MSRRRRKVRRVQLAAAANGERELRLEAIPVEISAAEGDSKLRKFSMTAYTGRAVRVAGFWDAPVVMDIKGIRLGNGKKPILLDHDARQRVGHTETVTADGAGLYATGLISGASAAAQEVEASSLNGFPWQASVGLVVSDATFVKEGKQVTVNGQLHEGPIYVARRSTLKEISFVTLGADDHTSAKVAAAANGKETAMNEFEKWLRAMEFDPEALTDAQKKTLKAQFDAEQKAKETPTTPAAGAPLTAAATPAPTFEETLKQERALRAAEESRVAAVREVAAKYPEILAKAIGEGWDKERTTIAVELAELRAGRPTGPAIHAAANGPAEGILVEAALAQAGRLDDLEQRFKPEVLEAAHTRYRGRIGLQEMLLEAAWQGGYSGRSGHQAIRGDLRQVLKAAFSTLSLPGILSNNANKYLLAGFTNVENVWSLIAARGNLNDFKTTTRYRMTGAFEFEELGPAGEIKHGNVGDESFTISLDTYAKMYAITRKDIINDDLGALTDIPRRIGRGAGLKVNTVFWTKFLDNASFFTTGAGNYFTGASTNLQSSSLKTALQMFRDQVDPDGKPLAITPRVLLVPTALEVTALELMTSTNYNTGGAATDTKVPNRNIWAGMFTPAVSAYLGNTTFSANASSTAWYLLADPQDIPVIEIAFLNGMEQPTVESADADFDTLGIQMRGWFDFGVEKQDGRGGVKSKGAA